MELSMTSSVARGQGLPLWAVLLALLQNQISMGFPDGTAPLAKPAAGYEPVRSSSPIPPPPTRREVLPPNTTATDAANRANGSSCGRNPGIGTAAPKLQSIPRLARRPDGYSSHALAPALFRHPAPLARIVYRIAAEALQSKARPHFARRVARRKSQGCVE